MPCITYSEEEERAILARAILAKDLQKQRQETKKAIKLANNLTRMLCSVLTDLEKSNTDFAVSEEVFNWWEQHKKADKARIRKEALAKLTPEEKRVLGL